MIVQHYVVHFRYAGKRDAIAGSASFVIRHTSTWHEVQERANAEAKVKLLEMFRNIFPDEALQYLKDPEYVETIPGALFFNEDEQ